MVLIDTQLEGHIDTWASLLIGGRQSPGDKRSDIRRGARFGRIGTLMVLNFQRNMTFRGDTNDHIGDQRPLAHREINAEMDHYRPFE